LASISVIQGASYMRFPMQAGEIYPLQMRQMAHIPDFIFYKNLDVLSTFTYIETQDVPLGATHESKSCGR
jgi:hypothetical protein